MKIHVLGVPHTQSSKAFSTCAFTQKVVKLCAMMHRRGHEVIHYGVTGSEVECTHNVSVATGVEWQEAWPVPASWPSGGTGQYEPALTPKQRAYLARWARDAQRESSVAWATPIPRSWP